MSWNGAGAFNRLYSWVADKAAGLDISSTRMDADSNDIAANGFGNCLTRDGQGIATANLPMGNFRHTGVGNAVNRTDYAAFGQLQDGLINWVVAGGTSDALTASYSPALTNLSDGQLCFVRATAANTTSAPTFAPNALTAQVITKTGGQALSVGDIAGNLTELILRYNLANTRWELLNPFSPGFTTGDYKLTLKTVADAGFVMANDGTIGNTSSGATYANANAKALYALLWNNVSNTYAPVTGGRGANANADWLAQKPIALTLMLGRQLAVAGAGSGLTSRSLGQNLGAETQSLSQGNLPNLTLTTNITDGGHVHGVAGGTVGGTGSGAFANGVFGGPLNATNITINSATTGITASTPTGGSGNSFSIEPPSSYLNVMIKL